MVSLIFVELSRLIPIGILPSIFPQWYMVLIRECVHSPIIASQIYHHNR